MPKRSMNCLNGRCASGNRHCAAAVCHVYIIAQWGRKNLKEHLNFYSVVLITSDELELKFRGSSRAELGT